MMKTIIKTPEFRKLAVLAFLMVVMFQGVAYSELNVGDIANNFTTVDMDGNEVSLYDYQGHVIFLSFFAFW